MSKSRGMDKHLLAKHLLAKHPKDEEVMKEIFENSVLNDGTEKKTHLIRIKFLKDSVLVALTVPKAMSLDDISSVLCKEFDYLEHIDEDRICEKCGKNTVSLLLHTSARYGWEWRILEEEMEVVLN